MCTPDQPRILFLCTGNSCRSQMGEAILRDLAADRFEAVSAGSHPAGFVHQLAVDALGNLGVPLGDLSSKSWDAFKDTPIDLVITVCDNAARETCPVYPGTPMRAHWPLPDPAFHNGDDDERLAFAVTIAERLRTKIRAMIELDWSLDRPELERRIRFLGDI